MTNHLTNQLPLNSKGYTKPINALNPILSIKEDYRLGNYYVKHAHQKDTLLKVYFVFKDNPSEYFRGYNKLFMSIDLNHCVNFINKKGEKW